MGWEGGDFCNGHLQLERVGDSAQDLVLLFTPSPLIQIHAISPRRSANHTLNQQLRSVPELTNSLVSNTELTNSPVSSDDVRLRDRR